MGCNEQQQQQLNNSLQYAVLTLTEQSRKLGNGIIALD